MPKLEILPPEKTHSVNLGPINAGEDTIAGNYDVLEKIFLQQLSLNHESNFSKRLFLVFGDQLTVARIRSIKSERREDSSAYERFNWLMPVPGLFHLKMNLLYSLGKSHRGDDDSSTNSYSAMKKMAHALRPMSRAACPNRCKTMLIFHLLGSPYCIIISMSATLHPKVSASVATSIRILESGLLNSV